MPSTTEPSSGRAARRSFLKSACGGLGCALMGRIPGAATALAAPNPDKYLQIRRIDRTTVEVPYRETSGRNMARELPHWRWTEICEVELASGHVGYGESLLYYTWGATEDDDVKRAAGKNAARLMWDDELGAGLQMALFDAVAKAADVPVHALLGQQVHDKTPLAWWNIDTTPEDMAAECREAYRQGYRSYKTKGRPWFDLWKQVELTAEAVPDSFHLAIDFNDTLLDAERGLPILRELQATPQIAIWETPIPQEDIAGNVAIRRGTSVPVAMHYGSPDPKAVIRESACDGFVIGGGARRIMRRGAVAAMAEMPFWLQLVGTGLTAAWSLHFGAVLSHATWPAVNCHQLFQHDLLADPIRVVDGYAQVPDQPGLGHGLDHARVRRWKVAKPARRPDPPRLIETRWPDGRTMYIANTGRVNFMLNPYRKPGLPYFERGVETRLVPDDGSPRWRQRYQAARQGPYWARR